MSIISAIKTADYGKFISRGIGAAALYFVARDAHVYGKIQADANMKTKNAEMSDYFLTNTMTLDKPSITKRNLQDEIFKYDLSHNIGGFVNSFIGYFKGLFDSLTSDVVPLGLGMAAVLAKGKGLPFAKASAAGLAVLGAFSFVKDGLGVGKSHDLNSKIE